MAEQNPLNEEKIKLIILQNNNELKDYQNNKFQEIFVGISRLETTQGNYMEFMKIITSDNKDIDLRLRNLEEMKGQMETIDKMAENLNNITKTLTKLENVPERLDQVVTKEEFEKTVTGLQNQIKTINEEHSKNTELRKNLAFLFLTIIVLVPLIMKVFESFYKP